jgi:YgiT-type zinc finger domain-containing protein
MTPTDFDRTWLELSEEVITGMKEWRLQHPRATFAEIEAALDERLAGLRARMLQDAALATIATDWKQSPPEVRPLCPTCGQQLVSGGNQERRLQTQGRQEIVLQRQYGVCPTCGGGLFPPG